MRHLRIAGAVVILVLAGGAITSALAAGGGGKRTSGTVYVAETPHPGPLLYIAGVAQDKVLGPTAVTYIIKASSQTSGTIIATAKKVTIWSKDGTLSGTGGATVTITDSKGDATVTNGKINLKQGTGGQVGHSFVATFTGSGNALSGTYKFIYKGTYK